MTYILLFYAVWLQYNIVKNCCKENFPSYLAVANTYLTLQFIGKKLLFKFSFYGVENSHEFALLIISFGSL